MTDTAQNGQTQTAPPPDREWWKDRPEVSTAPAAAAPIPDPPAPPPPPPAPPLPPAAAAQSYPVGTWPAQPPTVDQPQSAARAVAPARPEPEPAVEVAPVATAAGGGVGAMFAPVRGWWGKGGKRNRWLTAAGLAVLVGFGVRWTVTTASHEAGEQMAAPLNDMAAVLQASTAQVQGSSTQIIVTPTDWWPCPLTPLAQTAVGYDSTTKTLQADRAAEVTRQTRIQLAAGAKLTDLYISTPAPTSIVISATAVPDGTPLFNCSTPSVTPTTAAGSTTATSGR